MNAHNLRNGKKDTSVLREEWNYFVWTPNANVYEKQYLGKVRETRSSGEKRQGRQEAVKRKSIGEKRQGSQETVE